HRRGARDAEVTEGFLLAAYKASEFKVEAAADAKASVRGDDASFTVKGEYLFGAPMAGAAVHETLTRPVASFTAPAAEGLVNTDEAHAADEREQSARTADLGAGDDQLDASGHAVKALRLAMPGQVLPERVTFEAEVEDVSRQTVAQHASLLVHPAEI